MTPVAGDGPRSVRPAPTPIGETTVSPEGPSTRGSVRSTKVQSIGRSAARACRRACRRPQDPRRDVGRVRPRGSRPPRRVGLATPRAATSPLIRHSMVGQRPVPAAGAGTTSRPAGLTAKSCIWGSPTTTHADRRRRSPIQSFGVERGRLALIGRTASGGCWRRDRSPMAAAVSAGGRCPHRAAHVVWHRGAPQPPIRASSTGGDGHGRPNAAWFVGECRRRRAGGGASPSPRRRDDGDRRCRLGRARRSRRHGRLADGSRRGRRRAHDRRARCRDARR